MDKPKAPSPQSSRQPATTPGEPFEESSTERRPLPGVRWQVQLLGGLRVSHGDIVIPRFADRGVRLLFAHLALHPSVSHGRDSLACAIWPEVLDDTGREPDDAAEIRRRRLRHALSKLNGHFNLGGAQPVSPFVADRDTVRLNAEAFDIDVLRFERYLARRQWHAARACYRGELLPGLNDPWLDQHRVRLAAALQRCDTHAEPFDDDSAAQDPDPGDEEEGIRPRPIIAYLTRFFGRELQAEALRQTLRAYRVVTLVGPGGCGKTRLAAETASRLHGFESVTLVSLADCTAAEYVIEHLRAALELHPAARPAIDQVAERLDGQRALLLLDNFEQLAGAAGDAVLDLLLQRLPEAHFLLTSRRALRRADEQVIDVPLLALPVADADLALASRNACVALFVDRARAARADFTLNARNLTGVLEVCRLLEGLPLSIELAAARIRSHAPHEMVQALKRNFKLLARSEVRIGQTHRHSSLHAMLTWSWNLLGSTARDTLRDLSVFRGGWTVDHARALIDGQDAERALDALARDSLLQTHTPAAGGTRLSMLGVVREFVEGHCTPLQALALRRRHRLHFLGLARRLEAAHQWPDEADQPNLVEAMSTACADDEAETAAALAIALSHAYRARGAGQQVLDLLHHLSRLEHLPAAHRVALLALLTTMYVNAGRARDAASEAGLALDLAGNDVSLRAQACLAQADVHWRAGRTDEDAKRALALVLQIEALLDQLPPNDAAAAGMRGRMCLLWGAITLQHLQDSAGAAHWFEQAERVFGRHGDRRAAVLALPGRTACLMEDKRWREVIAVASKGEQLAGELGDVVTQLQLFDRLSGAYDALGQYENAVEVCQRQARLACEHGLHYYAAYGAWNQCQPLAQLRQSETAARLMAFASQYWIKHFGPLRSEDESYVNGVRQAIAEHIGSKRLHTEWANGLALTVHDALALAAGRASNDTAAR